MEKYQFLQDALVFIDEEKGLTEKQKVEAVKMLQDLVAQQRLLTKKKVVEEIGIVDGLETPDIMHVLYANALEYAQQKFDQRRTQGIRYS